jgi:hypothetical protein
MLRDAGVKWYHFPIMFALWMAVGTGLGLYPALWVTVLIAAVCTVVFLLRWLWTKYTN